MGVRYLIAAALAAALSACGGGGGGTPPAAPPTSGPTGLVPPAPPLGATLHADASTLRPVVDGGTWTYRGTETHLGTTTVYGNVMSHAGNGTSVVERGSNPLNAGTDETTLTVSGGLVRTSSIVSVGGTIDFSLTDVELRSPVRVDDQVTLLDERVPDSGYDLDGDGLADTLEIAMYRRVIGEETVDLPALGSERAVRVRAAVAIRFRLTRTGSYTQTETSTMDTWYAPGLGVVRRLTDLPEPDSLGERALYDEVLTRWDGVSRGAGVRKSQPAIDPAQGTALYRARGAAAFGAHALVLTHAQRNSSDGIALGLFDAQGDLLQVVRHPFIDPDTAQLHRVGDEARVLAIGPTGLQMHRFDSNGQRVAPEVTLAGDPILPTADSGAFASASTGSSLWAAWITLDAVAGYQLLLRPFDAAGQPLSPAMVLATLPHPLAVGRLQAAGADGRVIVTWNQNDGVAWSRRQAVVPGPGTAVPTVGTLLADGADLLEMRPAASPDGVALLWRPAVGFSERLGGITFDAAGLPWRSNGQALPESETWSWPWTRSQHDFAVGVGGPLAVYQRLFHREYPSDPHELAIGAISELRFTGPLATHQQARLLWRSSDAHADLLVGLDQTVLVFRNELDQVVVTSVWRRSN